jgi:hypothetical protein
MILLLYLQPAGRPISRTSGEDWKSSAPSPATKTTPAALGRRAYVRLPALTLRSNHVGQDSCTDLIEEECPSHFA